MVAGFILEPDERGLGGVLRVAEADESQVEAASGRKRGKVVRVEAAVLEGDGRDPSARGGDGVNERTAVPAWVGAWSAVKSEGAVGAGPKRLINADGEPGCEQDGTAPRGRSRCGRMPRRARPGERRWAGAARSGEARG